MGSCCPRPAGRGERHGVALLTRGTMWRMTEQPSEAEEPAETTEVEHRQRPSSPAFRKFIASGWAPRPSDLPGLLPAARYARARRDQGSRTPPGRRVGKPARGLGDPP